MKKKQPKINRKKAIRESMIRQGAYDGRFREKVVTLKKHKKPKHKKRITEE